MNKLLNHRNVNRLVKAFDCEIKIEEPMVPVLSWKEELSLKDFREEYIMVTEHNRSEMIKLGRTLFIVDSFHTSTIKPKLVGSFCVYPCKRARMTMVVRGDHTRSPKSYKMFCYDGESYEEWKNWYDKLITNTIKHKQLFIKKELQKCATFSWE